MEGIDLVNRDPNEVNVYIKASFEDVLAEPDGTHSINCIWQNGFLCYDCCKGCCYKLMTTLCGLCIAGCWGCEFAVIAFYHIWFMTPLLRTFTIIAGWFQKCIGTLTNCCIAPTCEACGFCLSRMQLTKTGS